MTEIGNHSIIALDTVTLSGSNNTLKRDARKLIQRLERGEVLVLSNSMGF